MFMNAVVLDAAVSTIYSATSYYSLLVQYAVFFCVLPCVIAASMYYAVFFRVRVLLSAYYDILVPDPRSRSRLQHLTHVSAVHAFAQCRMYTTAVLRGVGVLCKGFE